LRQAATVADVLEFGFMSNTLIKGDGDVAGVDARRTKTLVPASYVEFVDRLPTENSGGQNGHHVPERLLRDGFETANADAIFESTFRAQRAAGLGAS
jgi:hypothetical protein